MFKGIRLVHTPLEPDEMPLGGPYWLYPQEMKLYYEFKGHYYLSTYYRMQAIEEITNFPSEEGTRAVASSLRPFLSVPDGMSGPFYFVVPRRGRLWEGRLLPLLQPGYDKKGKLCYFSVPAPVDPRLPKHTREHVGMAVEVLSEIPSSRLEGSRGQLSGPYYKGQLSQLDKYSKEDQHGPLLVNRNPKERVRMSEHYGWTVTIRGKAERYWKIARTDNDTTDKPVDKGGQRHAKTKHRVVQSPCNELNRDPPKRTARGVQPRPVEVIYLARQRIPSVFMM